MWIGDKIVLLFEAADVAVAVTQGQAISFDIKQAGRFWNGKNLRIVDAKVAEKCGLSFYTILAARSTRKPVSPRHRSHDPRELIGLARSLFDHIA